MTDRIAAIIVASLFIFGSACFLIGNVVVLVKVIRS